MAETATTPIIDALANEIRAVDGDHSLGAGALAEALTPWVEELILRTRDAALEQAWSVVHPQRFAAAPIGTWIPGVEPSTVDTFYAGVVRAKNEILRLRAGTAPVSVPREAADDQNAAASNARVKAEQALARHEAQHRTDPFHFPLTDHMYLALRGLLQQTETAGVEDPREELASLLVRIGCDPFPPRSVTWADLAAADWVLARILPELRRESAEPTDECGHDDRTYHEDVDEWTCDSRSCDAVWPGKRERITDPWPPVGEASAHDQPSIIATGVELHGAKRGLWRGVVENVEDREPHTSGTHHWRCAHEHRTFDAAKRCGERELRTRGTEAILDSAARAAADEAAVKGLIRTAHVMKGGEEATRDEGQNG